MLTSQPVGEGPPLLLTVEEASHKIRVSRAVMYRLIAAGTVRSVKIGASRRIPVDALDEFIARLQDAR